MNPKPPPQNVRMHVHDRDDLRVDGILRLIDEGGRPGPLTEVLTRMCREVAVIAHADVVSVYVLEEDGGLPVLVMRGNVGFPSYAIGTVKLRLGEGITGFAAECMRPVSAAEAASDSHYKHVPDIGEERYPSFLAIPLLDGKSVAGVLVFQRHDATAFTGAEVQLATALATIFSHALERAKRSGTGKEAPAPARSARLTGTAMSPGLVLARAVPLPSLDGLPEPCDGGRVARERVEMAIASTTRMLQRAARRLETKLDDALRDRLQSVLFILDDQRLKSSIVKDCEALGVIAGLRKVAREYAAVPYRAGRAEDAEDGSDALSQRASEVADLCLLIALSTHNEPLHALSGSAFVCDDRMGSLAVLGTAFQRANAWLVAGPFHESRLPIQLARAAEMPVIANIAGLFAWLRPDDTLLIDGREGVIHVNPSPAIVARYRHERSLESTRAKPASD